MSTIQEIRTAVERVEDELNRLASQKITIILQMESATRERDRLQRQLKAATSVPTNRGVDVPGTPRWRVA